MDQHNIIHESAASSAPPVQPGPVALQQSTWPTVLGVIGIVFGAGGVLINGCGLVMMPFAGPLMGRMSAGAPAGSNEAGMLAQQQRLMDDWMVWNLLNSGLATLLAATLLIGGIGLLQRRGWAVATLRTWALLRIPHVVGAAALGFMVQEATNAMIQAELQSQQTPGLAMMMRGFGALGLVIGVLWGWALPAFVLFWFARGAVRAQTAEWS